MSNRDKQKSSGKLRMILRGCVGVPFVFFSLLIVIGLLFGSGAPDALTATGKIKQKYTILESENGTYYGPVVDLAYKGLGEFQYLSDGTYEGDFDNSERSGNGTFVWNNGDKFTGKWHDDMMVSGTYVFADGRIYKGTFSKNKFDDGTFRAPKALSKLNLKTLAIRLDGGKATRINLVTKSGARYVGAINGKAKIVYPSGNKYVGNVKNGVRSGEGTFIWMDNGAVSCKYKGGWSRGVMSGKGTYFYSSGKYPQLTGTFKSGAPTGEATYLKEAGNTFTTVWNNGVCVSVTES